VSGLGDVSCLQAQMLCEWNAQQNRTEPSRDKQTLFVNVSITRRSV